MVKNSYISRESLHQPLSVKKYFFLLCLSWTSMLSGSKRDAQSLIKPYPYPSERRRTWRWYEV